MEMLNDERTVNDNGDINRFVGMLIKKKLI